MKHVCEIGIGEKPLYEKLIDLGWQATFIDMHPAAFSKAVKRYSETENLQLMNVAVSESDGFERVQTKSPTSIDPWAGLKKGNETNDRHRTSSRYTDKYGYEVYAVSLTTLLEYLRPVDLLSMDVQGSEFGILRPYFRNQPRLINVECHDLSKLEELRTRIENRGYQYIRTTHKYDDKDRPIDLYESKDNRILHELSNKEKRVLDV